MTVPALELRGVTKRFGPFTAVGGVSLSVAPGEVVGLLGENGAGKSTLIQVACGLYKADEGEVHAFGKRLPPGDPRAAIAAGIGVVYQHFMLVGPLTVWENVILGQEPLRAGLLGALGAIDRERARREVGEAAAKAGLSLDLDATIETLGVGAQQRVEIVKQLWRGARVLILDEPTAVLGPAEARELAATVRRLAAEGRSVVFISHKLREVLALVDRVAVLRRGRLVHEQRASEATAESLAEAVMGANPAKAPGLAAQVLAAAAAVPARAPGSEALGAVLDPPVRNKAAPRLVAKDLTCTSDRGRPALRGLSFEIGAGELLGVAGVDGNGQGELAELLCGLRAGGGELFLDGAPGLSRSGWATQPQRARQAGAVHLPEDRHKHALCGPLTVEENAALGHHALAPWAKAGGRLIDEPGRRQKTLELLRSFDVRPPDPLAPAGSLSGGNQQKLVVARELAGGPAPKLVVAVQPSRGLDFVATARVHGALRAARAAGAAVLLLSLDLDELRALSDRILVLYEGRAAGLFPPSASDEELGRRMLGDAARAEAAHG
jgi:general nucleoside transport system ATP-binding protein